MRARRHALGASVALLALLAGGALRAENVTEIAQSGAQNLAVVDQAGDENVAGHEQLPMVQQGYYNELRIMQEGTSNRIGVLGSGLTQVGEEGTGTRFNWISIEQDSNNNLVGEVLQEALGAVPLGANRLEIRQEGGDNNRIFRVDQIQAAGMPGQSAYLEQNGTGNRLTLVRQRSVSADGLAANRIRAVISGNYNATTMLRGYASYARVRSGQLVQSTGTEDQQGNGNDMDLLVTGDYNDFGIRQRGRRNWVQAVTINGDYNALGIDQDGTHNDIFMLTLDGHNNEIGMIQLGTNTISMALLGDSSDNRLLLDQMGSNDVAVTMDGDRNVFEVHQGYLGGLEGDNLAEVRVFGSDNYGLVHQEGSNTFSLRIDGDSNNTRPFSTPIAAAEALSPGVMTQIGTDNSFGGTIHGDNNAVSFLQSGAGNAILLHVLGDDNDARFLQSGAGNAAELGQTGRGNQAVFIQ